MAAFKLGANDITAVYLGSQGICVVNDGADTVFDDGCGAQFTVTNNVDPGGISGTTNGYTVSTSPSSSKTGPAGDPYSFNTTVSLNSNYQWANGVTPTISPTQPITGVVGSANSTVTTTLSGATVETIPANVVVATLDLNTSNILGPSEGYIITGNQDGDAQSGTNEIQYSFNSFVTLVDGYEWVGGTAPTPASASALITSSATITTSFGAATVNQIIYTVRYNLTNNVQGPSAGYNLTWDGNSNYTSPTGATTRSGTFGESYSFPETTLVTNSGYTATQAFNFTGQPGPITSLFTQNSNSTVFSVTAGGTVALDLADVTVTLVITDAIQGGAANYTVATSGGLTRTGLPGNSYSFTTTVTPNSGYVYSGNAPITTTGTFPAADANDPITLTGVVSPSAISPGNNFNTVLYTGNTGQQNVSGAGFAPDFVWIKDITTPGVSHALFDKIRLVYRIILSNLTDAEATQNTSLTAFSPVGFSLSYYPQVNTSGVNYVAWMWKAGGAPVNNTDGTIQSSVSANTAAGFSIVKWSAATPTTINTIGHGLSASPELILIKPLDVTSSWKVYSKTIGSSQILALDTAAAKSSTTRFNSTNPTSSVFTFDNTGITGDFIAYCWRSIPGYSIVGSYFGDGTTSQTIYNDSNGDGTGTGSFQPAFLLTKEVTATGFGRWQIWDNKRSPSSPNTKTLSPNSNAKEINRTSNPHNFISNGFIINTIGPSFEFNETGSEYIYLAFA